MSEKKQSKDEVLKDLEELRKNIEEKNKYKKEKLFFQHLFWVYFNSNIGIFISFLLNIIYFILTYNILSLSKQPISVIIFIVITSICTNVTIALFRCSLNKEILQKFRKMTKTLSLQLALLVIVLMVSFVIF